MTDNAMVPAQPGGLTFGQTALTADQFIQPRVKIVQAMSQEKAGGLAKEGDFFNTLTSEAYGPIVRFLPIQPFMNRVLLVRDERREEIETALGTPLSEGDGLKCRSLDMFKGNGEPGIQCGLCPLSQWREGNKPPLCTEVYNVAALHELGDLIIMQFQKSSAKTGKKLFSMLRFVGEGVAPWSRFYQAETHSESIKGKGTFAVPVVTKTPEAPPTELMKQAAKWAEQLGAIGPIDVTPPEDEDVEAGAAADEHDPNAPF
jgi:hypothetical protein